MPKLYEEKHNSVLFLFNNFRLVRMGRNKYITSTLAQLFGHKRFPNERVRKAIVSRMRSRREVGVRVHR